jgi:hypothetical protein
MKAQQRRQSIHEWIEAAHLGHDTFLFPSRVHASPHLSTPRVREDRSPLDCRGRPWRFSLRHSLHAAREGFVDPSTLKNLRAMQSLLGHTKLENTVRYPGIEVDDALEMAEQTEA